MKDVRRRRVLGAKARRGRVNFIQDPSIHTSAAVVLHSVHSRREGLSYPSVRSFSVVGRTSKKSTLILCCPVAVKKRRRRKQPAPTQ